MVFEVITRPDGALYHFRVRAEERETGYLVLEFASGIIDVIMAIVFEVHAVVWASDGNEVAHWEFCVAGLYDVAADERALAETKDVELLLAKHLVVSNFGARFLSLRNQGAENGGDVSVANLDTLHVAFCPLVYLFYQIFEEVLMAGLFYTVEDGGGNRLILIRTASCFRYDVLGQNRLRLSRDPLSLIFLILTLFFGC